MFKAASSAYRASLSGTVASSSRAGGDGDGGPESPPPPPLRRPNQQLLRQRRRHTLSGGGGGGGGSSSASARARHGGGGGGGDKSTVLALLADVCQSTTCLAGLLLLGAALVAFSLQGLYGVGEAAPSASAALASAASAHGSSGGGGGGNLLMMTTPAGPKPPVSSVSDDPHAPALPPGTTAERQWRRQQQQQPGAPEEEGGDALAPAAAAPPPIHLDDALYAQAYASAFPISPLFDEDREEGEKHATKGAAESHHRPRRRRPFLHHRERRLAQARLEEGLPPAAAGVAGEEGEAGAASAPDSSTPTAAVPLLSASVAIRAIAPRGGRDAAGGACALPPALAVAVATFVSSEAQLEFALNWAAGLDAAGIDGGSGGDDDAEEGAAGGGGGYLAVATTPELAARLADAGVPSAVFPTPGQARAARAEWEAAARRLREHKERGEADGGGGEGKGEDEEAEAAAAAAASAAAATAVADVPTPLVAAEAAARGHPRVALARALLEFGFASALVTDPDVAWAAGEGQERGGAPRDAADPLAYLRAAAMAARADALVGSGALSPGAGRAALVDGGLDVPTALILGSSGVAELVQGGGRGVRASAAAATTTAATTGAPPPADGASAASLLPPPPPGLLLGRNQTNAAASAAFGASRRLTDGLLDPGFLYLRRTPAAVAFADAWCSVMAGRGEGKGGSDSSNGGGGGDSSEGARQAPVPPVDSHAFNRLALEGWEPRFVPAPGTWSALNATATTTALPPKSNVASPSVPAPERALVGWRGGLRLGVLPLASFPNGHAHFVQRIHDVAVEEANAVAAAAVVAAAATTTTTTTMAAAAKKSPPPPTALPVFAVRPGTHLFGGVAGKRHRLRDAGLWRLDGPEYFFGWDARDLLAADERARERATLRREREARERGAERARARDAAAARASTLAVAAGAVGRGMGAGELAAKFFRPFASSFSAWRALGGEAAAAGATAAAARLSSSTFSREQQARKKYVTFSLPMAPDLSADAFEALPGGAEEMAQYHAAGLALQREQLMAMVGVALALGRALVLPEFRCYCDRHWTMLHRCRVPGAGMTRLPFACPQDHVAEPGKFSESGLLGEAAPLEVREAAFLARARPPGAAAPRVLDVAPTEGLDAPREELGWVHVATGECRGVGEEGGPPDEAAAAAAEEGEEQQQPPRRCLRRVLLPLDTAQGVLRAHLDPYYEQEGYDVLRLSTPLRVLRSFGSPEAAAAAARRIAHLRGSDAGAGLPSSASAAAARRSRRRRAAAAAEAAAAEAVAAGTGVVA